MKDPIGLEVAKRDMNYYKKIKYLGDKIQRAHIKS